jgi:hypothetical protein
MHWLGTGLADARDMPSPWHDYCYYIPIVFPLFVSYPHHTIGVTIRSKVNDDRDLQHNLTL